MIVSLSAAPARATLRAMDGFLRSGSDNAVILRLLALFVVAWTTFQVVSYSSVGLHPDLTEIFNWAQNPTASYYKHPPLAAMMARGWFSILPVADWSFHLLAMLNAAIGLFFTDLIARRYLDRDKRIFVLLFLLLTPFYQFHGQRFASNQSLISAWPIATYCFIRSFENRGVIWPLIAGVAAAGAMMGKYFSAYLIAGFVAAALLHRDRMRYLASPAPWLSTAAGLLVLSPHLLWLQVNGPQTFNYAFAVHGNLGHAKALGKSLSYFLGFVGYLALPCFVYWLAVRPSRATLAEAFWPGDPARRMLVVLLAVPLVLPALVSPLLRTNVSPLWTMHAWFLLPIVLLAPASAVLRPPALVRTFVGVAAMTLVVLAAAPAIAWTYHTRGIGADREYARQLADEVTREWRSRYGTRLSIVGGDDGPGQSLTFYSTDHPDYVFVAGLWTAPWVTPERLAREGAAIVCSAPNRNTCLQSMQLLGLNESVLQKTEITLMRNFLGHTAAPQAFQIWFLPPSSKGR